MIYGDDPQKINERQDALGLTRYTYVPEISAVMQSGNLYVYGLNNPVNFQDPSGAVVTPANVIGAVIGAGGGFLLGTLIADYLDLQGWQRNLCIAGCTAGGAVAGWFAGPWVEKLAMMAAQKMGLIAAEAGTQIASAVNQVQSTHTQVATGQMHHVLSNRIMTALNSHPTLAGLFDRAASVVQALTLDAHKGYQTWHREIDNIMIQWLYDNPCATVTQFWEKLYSLYNTDEMIKRFGQGVLDYIKGMMK